MKNKIKYQLELAIITKDNEVEYGLSLKEFIDDKDEAIEMAKKESINNHNILMGFTHILVHEIEINQDEDEIISCEEIEEFEVHEYIKASSYVVEYDVSNIAKSVAWRYDVPNDYYGDCWCSEISDLMVKMRVTRDKREYDLYLEEIEEILTEYAKSYYNE